MTSGFYELKEFSYINIKTFVYIAYAADYAYLKVEIKLMTIYNRWSRYGITEIYIMI